MSYTTKGISMSKHIISIRIFMLTYRLSQFLLRARKGELKGEESENQEMLKLVERYSAFDTPPKSKGNNFSQLKVVVSVKIHCGCCKS
jgi:hypothetical protein